MKKLFYSLLTFGLIVFMFSGCETQEEIVKESGSKINTEEVSFTTLLNIVQNKMASNKGKMLLQKTHSNFLNRGVNDFITEIDTTKVERIEIDGKESFTLRLITKGDDINKFYNVVYQKEGDVYYENFIEYYLNLSEEEEEQIKNAVTTIVDENGIETNIMSGKLACGFKYKPIYKCNFGNAHSPDDAGSGVCVGHAWTIIGYEWEPLPCSNGNAPSNSPSNGGSGGGSGAGTGSNNSNTTGGVYGNGGTEGTGINTIPIVPSTYNDKLDDFLFDQISNNIIINNNLGPCNSTIITEFKTAPASNPNLARFLDKFNFNTNNPTVYGLEIKIDNLPSPNKSVTNYRYLLPQPSYGDYVIKIDANFSYIATKMAKVRTLVHEIIHAYLISLIDDATVGGGSIDISNYTDLVNAIEKNLYGINPSYYQHEAMANRFVGLIANVLKKFDGGTQSNQYYSDLAWGGLQNTDVYKALYPLDTENDQRITAINDAEDTNSNATTPDGITFTPKSQPCN